MTPLRCAAIDLGASSGRVIAATWDGARLALEDVTRFDTPLGRDPATGYQCWGIDAIEAHVRDGLRAAARAGPLASAGVDTWAVDFLLVDDHGERVAPAVSYRDDRNLRAMPHVFAKVPREELYERTGIAIQPYNTVYQLAATAREHPEWLTRARRALMVPDYLHERLCGVASNEYTNATSTQLYDVKADRWDRELFSRLDLPMLFADPVPPGTVLGTLREDGGGGSVKIIAPATHDTASAVAAVPLEAPEEVYISSGTWSLMGVESRVPFADATARTLNFTNEGGVERRFMVLKNIAGLWLVQRVREELAGPDHAALVAAAGAAEPWRSLVDPNDVRFLNPPSMVAAIRGFCRETGQPEPDGPGALARCVFDSLALTYRRVKGQAERMTGRPVPRIRIVGGGSRNRLLDQLCADACRVPVSAGPGETSALGNVCVQLIALGALRSLEEARAVVHRTFPAEEFLPRAEVPDAAWRRFEAFAAP